MSHNSASNFDKGLIFTNIRPDIAQELEKWNQRSADWLKEMANMPTGPLGIVLSRAGDTPNSSQMFHTIQQPSISSQVIDLTKTSSSGTMQSSLGAVQVSPVLLLDDASSSKANRYMGSSAQNESSDSESDFQTSNISKKSCPYAKRKSQHDANYEEPKTAKRKR